MSPGATPAALCSSYLFSDRSSSPTTPFSTTQSVRSRRATGEGRLQDALEHAGAELNEFTERGDVYAVTYTVDGERHTSVVDRRSLTVVTAGICLSGQDEKFDLASLVGVLRERDHDY